MPVQLIINMGTVLLQNAFYQIYLFSLIKFLFVIFTLFE